MSNYLQVWNFTTWKLSHKSRWMSPPLNRRLLYHPVHQKFAQNRSISYGFPGIDTFSFSVKIHDGRRKWRKLKFSPFPQDTLVPPYGLKIRSKSVYLLRFSRYRHFSIFCENPRWPPKVAETEIFPPFDRRLLYHPVGQKFARNRYIYYDFRDICDFSHFH